MGQVKVEDVRRITGTSARIAARLCNFETAKSYLLLSHQDFLDHEVAPVVRNLKGAFVDLFGYASRIGDAAFNMRLSQSRMESVKARISEYATIVNFRTAQAYGESESGPNERDDSGYYRAVEVYVYAEKPPNPTPPKPQEKLRRIIRRVFTKQSIDPPKPPGAPDFEKDAINEVIKLALAGAQGKLSAEGMLGSEEAQERRIQEFPSDFRVNRVTIDTKVRYDVLPGGGSITQSDTTLTYQWGPPQLAVVVESKYQATIMGSEHRPDNKTATMRRLAAELTPLVVPPEP